MSVRFRGRELSSVLLASAIVIACSKKEPPAPAPPDLAPAASASASTPDPAVTPPPITPPASSVVTTPTATATTLTPPPAEPSPSPDAKTTDNLAKDKAPHGKKPAKHAGPRSNTDSELDDLKQAQTDGDLDRPKKTPAPPPPPVTKPAAKPAPTSAPTTTAKVEEKADTQPSDKPSQPAGTALKRQVTVTTATHYACTTKDLKESVSVLSETRGARITIGGQGPCPGEIKEWTAEVADNKRVDVHGTHGAQSKCTCAGTGDMVLRGLEPGTYDVHVNGGYNRPIAVRVVVGQP